jgi:chromosome segregation ATPase
LGQKLLKKCETTTSAMPSTNEYTHPINVRSRQLDMPTRVGYQEDYDDKIKSAQLELERIQQEREELERKKRELEELTSRKRAFLSQQVELTEKLSAAITLIDRELHEMKGEMEQLEQCRVCFSDHLDKIQKHDPEKWTRDNLHERLEKASAVTDMAADEYDQAAEYFEGTRAGGIFGRASKSVRQKTKTQKTESEFLGQLVNGFAFNLPIIILVAAGLVVYFLK